MKTGRKLTSKFITIYSGNDFRGNMNRGGHSDRRDDRRDNNRRDAPRQGNEIRREEPKERRERNVKDLEERMPKYQAPAGPVRLNISLLMTYPSNDISSF